jgi:hypothetical protein
MRLARIRPEFTAVCPSIAKSLKDMARRVQTHACTSVAELWKQNEQKHVRGAEVKNERSRRFLTPLTWAPDRSVVGLWIRHSCILGLAVQVNVLNVKT